MTLREALAQSTATLAEHGIESARVDAELIVSHTLGLTRTALAADPQRVLTAEQVSICHKLVSRRAAREPVQYVLGDWDFRGLTLTVDRRALIPRPETEIVVERCLALLTAGGADEPAVLDVGTGSGAIALAIASERPDARVTGIDVSDDALALARENMMRTNLIISLAYHDLCDGLPTGPWDLVVSNPPYVEAGELADLEPEVVDWEPRTALVGDGHTVAIVEAAGEVIRPGGALVLETHGDRAGDVASLLATAGFQDVVVTRDLAGRDRVVEGRR